MATSPFLVNIYSSTYGSAYGSGSGSSTNPIATIRDARAIDATFRYNANGTAQIRLKGSDRNNDLLMQPDAYAEVFYRGVREMTGKIRNRNGSFTAHGDRIYTIRDDRAVLDDILAYPQPLNEWQGQLGVMPESLGWDGQWTGEVPNQFVGDLTGASGHYDWAGVRTTSPEFPWPFDGLPATTESAIRKLYYEQFYRIGTGQYRGAVDAEDGLRGLPITSLADLPVVRFGKLSDYINPMANAAGLGVRVLRRLEYGDGGEVPLSGGGLWLRFFEPREWVAPLTAASGVIVDPSTWSISDPTATRVLVGGPGEMAARALRLVVPGQFDEVMPGTRASEEEERIGWISEVFRDATSTQLEWPDGLADELRVAAYYMTRPEVAPGDKEILWRALLAAGEAALSDGAPAAGLSLTLAETKGFHYGGEDGIQLGDRVTAKDPSGLEFKDRLTEVTISHTAEGTKVTPKVGGITGDTTRDLYGKIARLAMAQRKMSSDK